MKDRLESLMLDYELAYNSFVFDRGRLADYLIAHGVTVGCRCLSCQGAEIMRQLIPVFAVIFIVFYGIIYDILKGKNKE